MAKFLNVDIFLLKSIAIDVLQNNKQRKKAKKTQAPKCNISLSIQTVFFSLFSFTLSLSHSRSLDRRFFCAVVWALLPTRFHRLASLVEFGCLAFDCKNICAVLGCSFHFRFSFSHNSHFSSRRPNSSTFFLLQPFFRFPLCDACYLPFLHFSLLSALFSCFFGTISNYTILHTQLHVLCSATIFLWFLSMIILWNLDFSLRIEKN